MKKRSIMRVLKKNHTKSVIAIITEEEKEAVQAMMIDKRNLIEETGTIASTDKEGGAKMFINRRIGLETRVITMNTGKYTLKQAHKLTQNTATKIKGPVTLKEEVQSIEESNQGIITIETTTEVIIKRFKTNTIKPPRPLIPEVAINHTIESPTRRITTLALRSHRAKSHTILKRIRSLSTKRKGEIQTIIISLMVSLQL